MADTNLFDYSSYKRKLDELTGKTKKAYDANYNAYLDAINTQKQNTNFAYNDERGNAYATSRLSANYNNELLANAGLAKNLYASPTSGYSETSRLQQDLNLQNIVGSLNSEERKAVQSLQALMSNAQSQRTSDMANIDADYNKNLIDLSRQQQQYDNSRSDTVLSLAQQYAMSGVDLPPTYRQAYEQYTGEKYDKLIKEVNPYSYEKNRLSPSSQSAIAKLENLGFNSRAATSAAGANGMTFGQTISRLIGTGKISIGNIESISSVYGTTPEALRNQIKSELNAISKKIDAYEKSKQENKEVQEDDGTTTAVGDIDGKIAALKQTQSYILGGATESNSQNSEIIKWLSR